MKAAERAKSKASARRAKPDRRVVRTRDVLGDALLALMREKKFEEITVQQLLDRAGVGRSTFYVHYRDKDDLLLSDVEDFLNGFAGMLKRQGASARRLLPVEEFFAHVRDSHDLYRVLANSGKLADVSALGQGIFARAIEERMESAGVEIEPLRRSAQAHAIAGSFFSLLDWWMDKGMKMEPKEMDEVFHQMAWSGLGVIIDG
jgi:AcrR family transcriptional regulator